MLRNAGFLIGALILLGGCDKTWSVRGTIYETDQRRLIPVVGDGSNLNPLGGAKITVRSENGYVMGRARTGNDGRFNFQGIDTNDPKRLFFDVESGGLKDSFEIRTQGWTTDLDLIRILQPEPAPAAGK